MSQTPNQRHADAPSVSSPSPGTPSVPAAGISQLELRLASSSYDPKDDAESALISDDEDGSFPCNERTQDLESLNRMLQTYDMSSRGGKDENKNSQATFNRRPPSDTPIMSGTTSPAAGSNLSPLCLSENEGEDSDQDDINQSRANVYSSADRLTPLPHRNKQHSATTSSQHVKTTLDIPGQTRSKISPDGSIVNTSERVVVVMIGLPARGKSYLSNKLVRYLNWLQINAKIFNVGSTRRAKAAHLGPESSPLPDKNDMTLHDAKFFSPNNEENTRLREQWAQETLDNLLHYLLKGDGCVGVFDATNSTKLRRRAVLEKIMERSKGQLKILFLESICNDKSILEDNIQLKLQGPDYRNISPEVAIKDFLGRLKNYESVYETIDDEEEKNKDFQYVKMIDVGRKVIACNIKGFLASQIIYYFLNFNLGARQIFITRHGESMDNVKGRIGGDSVLTERGHIFAKSLADFISFKKQQFRENQLNEFKSKHSNYFSKAPGINDLPEEPSFSVFTSMLQRSIQTSEHFSDEIFDIKQMRMLNELGSGRFEGMTYEEIQRSFPEEFNARLKDKMSYRYPGVGGESYLDVITRLKPVIMELERTTNHLLIITHRVVARVLIAYFLNLSKSSVGDLDVPLHTVYMFEPKPFGVDWHIYEFNENTHWFNEIDPNSLQNSKKVKQVGISFRERAYSVVPTATRRPSALASGAVSTRNLRQPTTPSTNLQASRHYQARLDNTNSNGLSHVSDGKSSKRWVLGEGLNTHWLGWDHLDDSSITGLDELRVLLHLLTSSSVNLLEQLVESTSNVGGVAVQNWRVTSRDLTRVVQDDDLSVERSSTLRRVVLGVTTDVTSSDFLNGDVLDVETNVVTWNTLNKLLVVHLNGLDFSGNTSWSESNDHTSLDDTGLDSSDWNSSNTADLVDILQWQSQWLVRWSGRWLNGVNSLQKSLTLDDTSLSLLLPSFVPWAVSRSLDHVVTVPTRNWDEWNSLRVVTNLLDEVRGFLDNFLKSGLVPLNRVHLVDSNNQLSDTKGESKQSVLSGLTVLGDTSLELTGTTCNDQDSTVSLGSTSDHVLDEISVTWSVNDGNVILWSLELPQSNIDSDTSLSLSLQLVQNPSVLERTLSEFSSFFFKLLDGSLVNTTTLVDQVAGSGRFTRVDVTNNNDVNVSLFFTHFNILVL
ncbi:hypothetical protein OGAPHI_002879 [Ogataea philodendri]|uniref:6-phosphofructo-2-kinase domain-containing protein n=1 Tax=Ogataea philodendri TaxID=1378263 RepID=A0A9P8P8N2_9ASCO|nr:uncharacterized protein OGAPHI_002879 [Ogataea philodendri]KAH3667230.1 hypothetical protein OGAPHI_002879 [Ogataea philodendri]